MVAESIFTGAGGAITDIAVGGGPLFARFASADGPSINDAGMVAFLATREPSAGGGKGIFTGAGGATTTIALSATTDVSAPWVPHDQRGRNGGVLFAILDETGPGGFSPSGIFTRIGGPTTTISQGKGELPDNHYSGRPSINAAGTVAFAADSPSARGIFAGAGGPTTRSSRLWGPSATPALRRSTRQARWHSMASSTWAVVASILGDGGAITDVISIGEALFGSTVDSLSFGPSGLNDAGQLAFCLPACQRTHAASPWPAPSPSPPARCCWRRRRPAAAPAAAVRVTPAPAARRRCAGSGPALRK